MLRNERTSTIRVSSWPFWLLPWIAACRRQPLYEIGAAASVRILDHSGLAWHDERLRVLGEAFVLQDGHRCSCARCHSAPVDWRSLAPPFQTTVRFRGERGSDSDALRSAPCVPGSRAVPFFPYVLVGYYLGVARTGHLCGIPRYPDCVAPLRWGRGYPGSTVLVLETTEQAETPLEAKVRNGMLGVVGWVPILCCALPLLFAFSLPHIPPTPTTRAFW